MPFRLRYLLVGRDREGKPNYGEQPGVIYSNVKVYVEDTSIGEPDVDGGTDGGEPDGGGDNDLRVVIIEPVEDTFAHYLEPDLPHGDLPAVQIGGDGTGGFGRIIYFKFDLRSLTGPVYSARLHLRATNAGGGGWITGVPDNSWQEETLTWNQRPAAGAQVIDQLGRVEIDEEYSLDLTHSVYVGEFNSFAMLSTESDGAAYGSKEHSESDYRPLLELVLGQTQQDGYSDAGQDAGAMDAGSDAGADPGSDTGQPADPANDTGPDAGAGCIGDQDCPEGQVCRAGVCEPSPGASCGCAEDDSAKGTLFSVVLVALAAIGLFFRANPSLRKRPAGARLKGQ